ncbi:SDR family NAD(P)-dependent oxidoreductase [Demequina sp.]|uniref:SDR family NAD(P)-dependent oxidoreductase n=1 Tax=Demequina sp. TaxID=2050685 RepID=UPI0025FBEC32|nr:SDR family oxidoreductase [Demequina sp.]
MSAGNDWLGLEGARVLIAGAGGIGGACAAAFAEAGATVAVVDRDPGALNALDPAPAHRIVTDLTARGAGARAVDEAAEALGGLDVALHAVGVNDRRPVLDISEDDWERVIRVNLLSVFGFAQAAGRRMVAQGHGRVLALSSVSGLLAHHSHGPYAASKGGINQLLRVMAREWAPNGVTVNALAPGYIETALTSHHLDAGGHREELTRLVPAGRLGVPEEVASAAVFLASRQAAFITGQVHYIDGGRTLV